MRSKRSKNYIDPLGGTYLHGLRKGVTPPPPPSPRLRSSNEEAEAGFQNVYICYLLAMIIQVFA